MTSRFPTRSSYQRFSNSSLDALTVWKGAASTLLEELNKIAPREVRDNREWPKKPHSLSGKLRRLAPSLEAVGLQMERDRDDSAKRSRSITLRTISQEHQAEPASGASDASRSRPTPDAPDAPDAPPPARSDADHWTPFAREPSLN